VNALRTRGPRLTGIKPASSRTRLSESSQSPSGPIAMATSPAGAIPARGTAPSCRIPASLSGGRFPESASRSGTGSAISGTRAAPHWHEASSSTRFHRAIFLALSPGRIRDTERVASKGRIKDTPVSVAPLRRSSKSPPLSREAKRTIRGWSPAPGSGEKVRARTLSPLNSSLSLHRFPSRSPSRSSPGPTLMTLAR